MCEPSRPRHSIHRCRRRSWTVSLLVHAALATGLLATTFDPWWARDRAERDARAIVVTMASGQAEDETDADRTTETHFIGDPADVTAAMVRERLERTVAESDALPQPNKLDKLDALSERLTQVADPQSLRAMSAAMQSYLGIESRAAQPTPEAPGGQFDFDTAQSHDIRREPKPAGGYRYVATLLDADGRTVEVELAEQEGEPIFETMQRIKANPLLEQIYRHIVMPLLDKMMAGVKQTAQREPLR